MPATPNTKRDEKESSNDLYITPKEAMEAILPYIQVDIDDILFDDGYGHPDNLHCYVLDPCQGLGDIAEFFNKNSDVYMVSNELYPCYDETKLIFNPNYYDDFLADGTALSKTKNEYDMIIVNPPYNKAMEFVLKGFEYAPIQWHFLRLSFLEGKKRYEELFKLNHLSDVYLFTYRVSCDKGYDREETANSVCYAWYRFDKEHNGHPTLHWLTKGE